MNGNFLQRMKIHDEQQERQLEAASLLTEMQQLVSTLTSGLLYQDKYTVSDTTTKIAVVAMLLEQNYGNNDRFVPRDTFIFGAEGEGKRSYWYTCEGCGSSVCIYEKDTQEGMDIADAYMESTDGLDWYFSSDGPLCNICF